MGPCDWDFHSSQHQCWMMGPHELLQICLFADPPSVTPSNVVRSSPKSLKRVLTTFDKRMMDCVFSPLPDCSGGRKRGVGRGSLKLKMMDIVIMKRKFFSSTHTYKIWRQSVKEVVVERSKWMYTWTEAMIWCVELAVVVFHFYLLSLLCFESS